MHGAPVLGRAEAVELLEEVCAVCKVQGDGRARKPGAAARTVGRPVDVEGASPGAQLPLGDLLRRVRRVRRPGKDIFS